MWRLMWQNAHADVAPLSRLLQRGMLCCSVMESKPTRAAVLLHAAPPGHMGDPLKLLGPSAVAMAAGLKGSHMDKQVPTSGPSLVVTRQHLIQLGV